MSTEETRPTGSDRLEPTDWERAAAARVADLRMRLLDLKNSNRLLNFKFTERSRSHVRVIETSSDAIFANLVDGKRLRFRALPEKSDEPPDEKSDQFLMVLEQARNSDSAYRGELDALDDDPDGEETRRIERRLKDRLRAQLGLNGVRSLAAWCLGRRCTWPASSGVGSEDCVEPDEPGGDGGGAARGRPRSPVDALGPDPVMVEEDGQGSAVEALQIQPHKRSNRSEISETYIDLLSCISASRALILGPTRRH